MNKSGAVILSFIILLMMLLRLMKLSGQCHVSTAALNVLSTTNGFDLVYMAVLTTILLFIVLSLGTCCNPAVVHGATQLGRAAECTQPKYVYKSVTGQGMAVCISSGRCKVGTSGTQYFWLNVVLPVCF